MRTVTRAGRCLLTQAQNTRRRWGVVYPFGRGEGLLWPGWAHRTTHTEQTHLPKHGCQSSHGWLQEITLSVRSQQVKWHNPRRAVFCTGMEPWKRSFTQRCLLFALLQIIRTQYFSAGARELLELAAAGLSILTLNLKVSTFFFLGFLFFSNTVYPKCSAINFLGGGSWCENAMSLFSLTCNCFFFFFFKRKFACESNMSYKDKKIHIYSVYDKKLWLIKHKPWSCALKASSPFLHCLPCRRTRHLKHHTLVQVACYIICLG